MAVHSLLASLLSLPLAVATLAADKSPPKGGISHVQHPRDINTTYDYIIVGGGTSGLTVANRLTAHAHVSVLVVEMGQIDNGERVLLPYTTNVNSFHDLAPVTSMPLKHLSNTPYFVAAAATVGGGSVINGMFFDRASAADYDAWEQLGNPGWGFDDLLPYFIKSTNWSVPSPEIAEMYNYTWDESCWGQSGPIHSSIPPFQWPELPTFLQAWREMGDDIRFPEEGNDGSGLGVMWVPSSQDPTTQTRSSAKTGYYDPIADRSNLHLLTQTRVEKVNFKGKTAVGITMTSLLDSKTYKASARKEVIMAAGPVFSTNLLHKSGIGPQGMLEAAGIEVIEDLPGVGTNFQDHPALYMYWDLLNDTYPSPGLLQSNTTFFREARDEYDKSRSGPLIQPHGNNAAFLSLRTISPDVDEIVAQIAAQDPSRYLPDSYDFTSRIGYAAQHAILVDRLGGTKSAVYEMTFNGGKMVANAFQKPLSRGTIVLNVSDPLLGPQVDYNTLANPMDGIITVAMLNYTRKFYQTPSMQSLGASETIPGPGYVSTEDILKQFQQRLLSPSFSHPSCSNPMMPLALGGVVSPELLVYGVERLSVVDVSIMPMIPATHLCGTVYAIAEKAADLIKARNSEGDVCDTGPPSNCRKQKGRS
ncbi:unnamed protein product [Zymoseptoria tritici ST99CH_1A5]|uniref:Glucose-methanol-choline oxidoreductase N-terminal domain-containing protein n=1 Tax=Zymoseptoria tritici ST99CH_1A5 TaxID=1276529 RepID=A0A1Y6LJ06_ZYMTR|nr:unnamed protein product [Zymoseptoria tritici ST99CH_1A5]